MSGLSRSATSSSACSGSNDRSVSNVKGPAAMCTDTGPPCVLAPYCRSSSSSARVTGRGAGCGYTVSDPELLIPVRGTRTQIRVRTELRPFFEAVT